MSTTPQDDELRKNIEAQIWEAVDSAGLDPESQKGKDIIAFRSEDILVLIKRLMADEFKNLIGEDELADIQMSFRQGKNKLRQKLKELKDEYNTTNR